jgi:hypothetical protein
MAQHPHLFVQQIPDPIRFTSPNSGRQDLLMRPARDRAEHAQSLIAKLETFEEAATDRTDEQKSFGLDDGFGIYLTFQSEPNFELKFESLDVVRSGIELCNLKTTADNRTQATVYVPDGKLEIFLNKIVAYRDRMTKPRKEDGPSRPQNQDLVESIADIQLAALEAFWTEPEMPFPEVDAVTTWEVWLRRSKGIDQLQRLRDHAAAFELVVGAQTVSFIDRKIVLVTSTAQNLSRSIEILGMIAEVRLPKISAAFFTEMNPIEQQDVIDGFVARMTPPTADAPYICLLDSGVNHGHPLLTMVADEDDMHAYRPAWGKHDWKDHGTPMGRPGNVRRPNGCVCRRWTGTDNPPYRICKNYSSRRRTRTGTLRSGHARKRLPRRGYARPPPRVLHGRDCNRRT